MILLTKINALQSQVTCNPIYHFYKKVKRNLNRDIGNPGDKHYRCLYGG